MYFYNYLDNTQKPNSNDPISMPFIGCKYILLIN